MVKTTQDALGKLPPAQNPFFQGNVVDVFDLETGDFRPAALQAANGTGDLFGRISWSPDGQTLLTQMEHPARLDGRRYPIYLFPDRTYLRFYDTSLRQTGVLKRPEIEAPFFAVPLWIAPDEVVINAPVGLSYRLFHYTRDSGKFRPLTTEEGTYYQVRATHQSQQLIFNFSSFQQPYELYRIGWSDSERTTLTDFNAELAELNAIRADQVTFKLRSGAKRTGYLLQPADAAFPPRKVPIVMWQQGGPGGTITNEWGTFVEQPFNLLLNFGIAVLVVPLPGREGFGPQFYRALFDGRNFGQIDIDEGVEVVQQLIKQGYTTPERIGISGCSYGGYFTSQSITRHPDVYAAANTQCSLLDLFQEWQFGWTPVVSQFMGRVPTEDPEEYTRDSPFYNASKVRTPLLIFHGTEDFLPILTALNFHDQVEVNGTPVLFLQFQDEGHGLGLPASQLTAGQAQIKWFREYLEGARR